MNDIKSLLPKLPYWDQLNVQQKDYISDNTTVRHYKKGSVLHSDGDSCLGMLYIIKGQIRIYLLSEEGREVTLLRLETGDPCVLSASCVISQITFDVQMVVEQDCDLLVVNSAAFRHLTNENLYVKCFMYELTAERFSTVMWAMQQILFAKFDRRLAAFLLKEYDKTGDCEIRMTHEQIAVQVSSAREVVARMLKRFAADGLVELKRGAILLKDVEQLRAI
jgi:CRP/FNR family transcriptional regulator